MSCGSTESIDIFFNAKSVAIYGASASQNSVGQSIVQNFIKPQYAGKVYAVNPKYTQVLGVPCFATLQEIKDPIDLVIVAVPARITPRVFEDIAAKGVKASIIISGGFSETGAIGTDLENAALAAKGLAKYGEIKYGDKFNKTLISNKH